MQRYKISARKLVTLFLAMVVLAALFLANQSPLLAQNPEVTFPAPNLEAAIREAVDKAEGPIYASDLDELRSFKAVGIVGKD